MSLGPREIARFPWEKRKATYGKIVVGTGSDIDVERYWGFHALARVVPVLLRGGEAGMI